jgi:hypothetical protein
MSVSSLKLNDMSSRTLRICLDKEKQAGYDRNFQKFTHGLAHELSCYFAEAKPFLEFKLVVLRD